MPAYTPTARTRGLSALLVVAALVLAPAAPALAEDHTVRAGETLADIARAHGTTVAALAAANGISNPNYIVIGQVLALPTTTTTPAASVVHRVAAGETLSDIARRYGVTVASLAAANGITDPNRVRVGQSLTIPTGGPAAAAAVAAPRSHTVTAGETLGAIAGRYGVRVDAIVDANNLANPSLLRIGQRLAIPPSPAGASGSGAGGISGYGQTGGADGQTGVAGTHTVGSGESLQVIGARYGVTVADLAAANGILPPYRLYAGARLFLSAPNRLPTDIDRCPVEGASYTNDWGLPRPGGRAHAGTDLLAKAGTPVYAPVAGTVSYLIGTRGGLQFWLRGDDGTRYIGAHLQESGDSGRVDAGDVIGYVGTTGAEVAVPHLHFEIQPGNGAAMNPYPVLRVACE